MKWILWVVKWALLLISSIIALIIIALFVLSTWKNAMTPHQMKLIPEPRLGAFIVGRYEFDEQATIDHYNRVFAGRSATEIVHFLEENKYHVFFDGPDEIGFYVNKRVVFFEYGAKIKLKFNSGMFVGADVTNYGVK